MSALDPAVLAFLLFVLLGAGAIGGVLAGLFGVGGGGIFVPVLYHAFVAADVSEEVAMHLAIGTSLAIILPTAIRSVAAHRVQNAVDMRLLTEWAVVVPAGVVAGTFIAAMSGADALKGIFAAIAASIALRLFVGRLPFRLGDDLPGLFGRSVAGFVIGVLSALMGVGGGVLNTTFMTAYGRTIHQGVATSAGVGALIAVPGLVSYAVAGWGEPDLPPFSLGYVSLVATLIAAPVAMLVAPFGARLAHRTSKRNLEIGFACFLCAVAAQFAADLLGLVR
ncbi:MAG: sulfite exporter TauE/SafE family protein [Rhizobiaceae bacterium]|nr:sulfite exporter TauE/SafE family protein [Rhizobiaceae bacterium]